MLAVKNVIVNGRRTSMRLEPSMWESLNDISRREGMRVSQVVSLVERKVVALTGECSNLTSSVRTFVAEYYRAAATEEGHRLAGHGCGDPVEVMPQDAAPKMENVELPEHSGQLASEERCLIAEQAPPAIEGQFNASGRGAAVWQAEAPTSACL
ncbi:ribbon-helix-helix domain-containing protein [Azospirillum tabaci]|uniref:ribbon-helix-helix domain-containing protein n=1 Tax=Azospirillum tabaci TaxID=2752310 RepID=UPI0016613D3E|nr:ribbon-helix-helix domain-containing protein [Azospirillum tabaci]